MALLDKDLSIGTLCPYETTPFWDSLLYFSLSFALYRVFQARWTNLKVQTSRVVVDLVDDVRDLNVGGIVATPPHRRLSGIKLS